MSDKDPQDVELIYQTTTKAEATRDPNLEPKLLFTTVAYLGHCGGSAQARLRETHETNPPLLLSGSLVRSI
jgi:hypothetical protein